MGAVVGRIRPMQEDEDGEDLDNEWRDAADGMHPARRELRVSVTAGDGKSASIAGVTPQDSTLSLYRKVANTFDVKEVEMKLCFGTKVIVPGRDPVQAYGLRHAHPFLHAGDQGPLPDVFELQLFRRIPLTISNPGESRYDENYVCTVKSLEEVGLATFKVTFEVVGDMSLGELQGPEGSRLVSRIPESQTELSWSPSVVECSIRDPTSKIAGSLVFSDVTPAGIVNFEYGSGGYKRLAIDLGSFGESLEEGPKITVEVTMLSGKKMVVSDVDPKAPAVALYRQVAETFDMNDFEVKLCLGSQVVEPNQTPLETYGLADGASLVLIRRAGVCLADPGVSRYNSKYFCTVKGVEEVGLHTLMVTFEVRGDYSLGQLQHPEGSVLFWQSHPTWKPATQTCTSFTQQYTTFDQNGHISGTLTYKDVPTTGTVFFKYGSSGYSALPIDLGMSD